MAIKVLQEIPGVGESMASVLWDIGIKKVKDLRGKKPELMYHSLNELRGKPQDRCVLYAFRCAVYYASVPTNKHDQNLLKWWNWKDKKN